MASVDCEWWTVTRGEKIEDAGSGLEYGIETFGGAEGCQGKIFHFLQISCVLVADIVKRAAEVFLMPSQVHGFATNLLEWEKLQASISLLYSIKWMIEKL